MEKIKESVRNILVAIGEDPDREGLLRTPDRVEKAYAEMFAGYNQNPQTLFDSCFASDYADMVIVKNIDFFSFCEHHILPFFGKIHIAYIPDGKVLGLSKFARLAEIYSRRLQIQENLTKQICDDIVTHLKPLGALVVIEATHLCMAMRGVQKINSITKTSAVWGILQTDHKARSEALNLMK